MRALDIVKIEPIGLIDIALTALLIYGLFSLIRGTRAVRLVLGVTILYGVYLAAQFFNLQLLSQVLQTGAVLGLLALVVVFQPELRRALMRLGETRLFRGWSSQIDEEIEALVEAATFLSRRKIGALVAIEREVGLGGIAESGTRINADLTASLLESLFWPNSPLHD